MGCFMSRTPRESLRREQLDLALARAEISKTLTIDQLRDMQQPEGDDDAHQVVVPIIV